MSYQVVCECGKSHTVVAADAGTALTCGCGRTIDVPPLHQLRQAAGEVGGSPDAQLEFMLLNGEFPGSPECVCCGRRTNGVTTVTVVCERTEAKTTRSGLPLLGYVVFGVLGAILLWLTWSREVRVLGRDVSFTLPLRVCEECDHGLTGSAALAQVLRRIPVCDALLKKYPHAAISRVP